ncbi:MAG TPA: hypothetical protein VGV60_01285 [Candidatus Polarisedimenticolia bacterium]|jgi:hypothetical protein|nr:hypothetical protein [Candidatus Polarisedimenticolia bacterium]
MKKINVVFDKTDSTPECGCGRHLIKRGADVARFGVEDPQYRSPFFAVDCWPSLEEHFEKIRGMSAGKISVADVEAAMRDLKTQYETIMGPRSWPSKT